MWIQGYCNRALHIQALNSRVVGFLKRVTVKQAFLRGKCNRLWENSKVLLKPDIVSIWLIAPPHTRLMLQWLLLLFWMQYLFFFQTLQFLVHMLYLYLNYWCLASLLRNLYHGQSYWFSKILNIYLVRGTLPNISYYQQVHMRTWCNIC